MEMFLSCLTVKYTSSSDVSLMETKSHLQTFLMKVVAKDFHVFGLGQR